MIPTVKSIIDAISHLWENGITVEFDTIGGLAVDIIRNAAVERFLKTSHQVLVFIDDDMSFKPSLLTVLVRRALNTHGIASGAYCNKAYPYAWMFKRADDDSDAFPTSYDVTHDWTDVKCCGTGIMAIHREVFEALERPFFLLRTDKRGEIVVTEDVFFTMKVFHADLYQEVYTRPGEYASHWQLLGVPKLFEHPYVRHRLLMPFDPELPVCNVVELPLLDIELEQLDEMPRIAMGNWFDAVDDCAHPDDMILKTPFQQLCKQCGLIWPQSADMIRAIWPEIEVEEIHDDELTG